MDTLQAFAMGEAARATGKRLMVFDWHKAAELIKEKKPNHVEAYLAGDRGWTGAVIYSNGKPCEKDMHYFASIWATPTIELDGWSTSCFVYGEETEWDDQTWWPESARKLLAADESDADEA